MPSAGHDRLKVQRYRLTYLNDKTRLVHLHSLYKYSHRYLSPAYVYSTHMFTSAMSLNVDVSSEFRNADATTSSLGAPILGVQSESPVSGTTSSCVWWGDWSVLGVIIWLVFGYLSTCGILSAHLHVFAKLLQRHHRVRLLQLHPEVVDTEQQPRHLCTKHKRRHSNCPYEYKKKLTSAVPSPVIHQGHPAPTEHTGIVNSHSINERDMCRV